MWDDAPKILLLPVIFFVSLLLKAAQFELLESLEQTGFENGKRRQFISVDTNTHCKVYEYHSVAFLSEKVLN